MFYTKYLYMQFFCLNIFATGDVIVAKCSCVQDILREYFLQRGDVSLVDKIFVHATLEPSLHYIHPLSHIEPPTSASLRSHAFTKGLGKFGSRCLKMSQ